jgi:hypothetical protein
MLKRLAFMLVLIVTLAAGSWAQESTPKPIPNAQKIHWHKYINKEFGFSVRYPDSYRPITDQASCGDNDYRRWLLCLERRDDPDTTIMVTIIITGPFFHNDQQRWKRIHPAKNWATSLLLWTGR